MQLKLRDKQFKTILYIYSDCYIKISLLTANQKSTTDTHTQKKTQSKHSLMVMKEFPGSSVVRTWCFHCGSLGSISGQGTKIPKATAAQPKKKKRERETERESESSDYKRTKEGNLKKKTTKTNPKQLTKWQSEQTYQ